MEIRGYKRIKKKDIRRWFKGSNLILYILILLLMFALILFAYKTIIGMHNDNIGNEQNQEDTIYDTETSDTGTTAYIARNQSYHIRINVSKNIAVISGIDSNGGIGTTVHAFYVAVNKNIKTGSTVISDKSEWKKLDNEGYAHYNTRLDNSEYICSTPYFTKTIGNMNIDEYNKISTSLSYGSIFMTPADAKWIYNNCGVNTVVEILADFDIPSDAHIAEFKKYNYIDKLEE